MNSAKKLQHYLRLNISYSLVAIVFCTNMFGSCSTDLDVWDEQSSKPIIYALINPQDTVHYVRVQRTFMARSQEEWLSFNTDSLYFNDVEVYLFGRKKGESKWVRQFSETIEQKEDGFFPTESHRVFRLDSMLPVQYKDGVFPDVDSLKLEVWVRDLDLVATSYAKVMKAGQVDGLYRQIGLYGEEPIKVSITGGTDYECNEKGPNPCYHDIEFWVHITEHTKNASFPVSINWKTHQGWDYGLYVLTPERIFNRLRMTLSKHDSILARSFDSIDVAITIPSKAFHDFWAVRKNSDQTDIVLQSIDQGLGLFATLRSAKKTGLGLDRQTMDSLCYGYWYKEMKFRYW